jgi:hypothetical protein
MFESRKWCVCARARFFVCLRACVRAGTRKAQPLINTLAEHSGTEVARAREGIGMLTGPHEQRWHEHGRGAECLLGPMNRGGTSTGGERNAYWAP